VGAWLVQTLKKPPSEHQDLVRGEVADYNDRKEYVESKYEKVELPTSLVNMYKDYHDLASRGGKSLAFLRSDASHFFENMLFDLSTTSGRNNRIVRAHADVNGSMGQLTWNVGVYYSAVHSMLLLTPSDFLIQLKLVDVFITAVKTSFNGRAKHLALETEIESFSMEHLALLLDNLGENMTYWLVKLGETLAVKSFTALIGGVQDTDLFQVISLRASPDEDWPWTVAEAVTNAVIPFACAGNSNMKLVMVFNL
jgi:hypothetical protein